MINFKQLLERATKRPWTVTGYAGEHDESGAVIQGGDNVNEFIACTSSAQGQSPEAWAKYIANARLLTIGANHAESLVEKLKAIVDCYGVGYKNPLRFLQDMDGFMQDARELLAQIEKEAAQ